MKYVPARRNSYLFDDLFDDMFPSFNTRNTALKYKNSLNFPKINEN